jgi:hypothetical protein
MCNPWLLQFFVDKKCHMVVTGGDREISIEVRNRCPAIPPSALYRILKLLSGIPGGAKLGRLTRQHWSWT